MTRVLPKISDRYGADKIKSFYEGGYWTNQTLLDLVDHWAGERPDDIFVTDGTSALTFAQLCEAPIAPLLAWSAPASRPATPLSSSCRTGPIFLSPPWPWPGAGPFWCPSYHNDEVSYILQHSGARAVITCKAFGGFDFAAMYSEIREACPEVDAVYLARMSEGDNGAQSLSSLRVEGEIDDLLVELGEGPGADDGHLIIYTSGTTARPKGCFHTWNTIVFTVRVMAQSLDYSVRDVAFVSSPVTHGTGYMTSVLIPLFASGKSHFMESWDPKEAPYRIAKPGCTTTVTATPFLQILLDHYNPQTHDLSSMRFWVAAGAPIPASIFERSRIFFPRIEVLSLYGRSENFLTTMCNGGSDPKLSTTTDDCAPAGVEVAAVDGHGKPAGPGEEGDLCDKGPGHMIEYYRQPDLTAELFTEDGFSRSGDLG